MSDFHSDLKNNSFVKSPADAVVDLYEAAVDYQISTMSTSVGPHLAGFMRGPGSPQ